MLFWEEKNDKTNQSNYFNLKKLTPKSFKAHPNKQVSGQMQTGILVRISNQSFSCATLNGNGMGLCTVVPPEDEDAEAEVEGGMFEGRVGGDLAGEDTGCGLSHITPHSVPG